MTKNMGAADRIVRFVVVVAIAILYFSGVITGTWAIILGVLAVVFLATSLIGFCPLYVPFNFSTRRQ